MSQGNPAKTTLTPAFLSYRTAFKNFEYGSGAAISFILFLIIVVITVVQRWLMRERRAPGEPSQARSWLPRQRRTQETAEVGERGAKA